MYTYKVYYRSGPRTMRGLVLAAPSAQAAQRAAIAHGIPRGAILEVRRYHNP